MFMKVLCMGKTSHLTYWHLILRELPQKRDLAVIGFVFSDKKGGGGSLQSKFFESLFYLVFCRCVVERGVGS